MTSNRYSHCLAQVAIRFALGAACWLAVILLSATEAQATCGDYLHSKGMRHSHTATTEPIKHTETEQQIDDQGNIPKPSSPCQGPHCQRREPAPLAPVPVPDRWTLRSVDEALLSPTLMLDVVHQGVAYHEAAVSASAGFSGRVERPPRSHR